MLILEAKNIRKFFGDRLIFELKDLKVYSSDRIGIVGLNGAGKTTLLNILSGNLKPDEGYVKVYGNYSYITQLEGIREDFVEKQLAGKFNVNISISSHMSGGEKTRLKIAQCLSRESQILFADEPTTNLDIKGIELLENSLKEYAGALMLISHDRDLLDSVCNKILEIEDGKINIYNGNYTSYKTQKAMNIERQKFEYEEYINEKKRLEKAVMETKEKVKTMKKTPSRMGNSEARLHKRSTGAKKARLERSAKAIESRIELLEVRENPKETPRVKIDIQELSKLHGKIVVRGINITKFFGNRVLLDNASFSIKSGGKTALIGDNGTGKTTLINMILSSSEGIEVSNAARIGYFNQDLSILDENKSILENVMETSIQEETFVRITLARLLFKREDVYKNISVLSGGERVKVSFAKIFLSDINMIVLDEPTNYLDIYSQEALENVLKDFDGTLLFVSHDRKFIRSIADNILLIENKRITSFQGNYDEYMQSMQGRKKPDRDEARARLLVLESRLAEVSGRLSLPSKGDDRSKLDLEFKELVKEIRAIKACLL